MEEQMPLQGNAQPAANGAIGFDIATRVNSADARKYASQGYQFCIRYVSRDDGTRRNNEANGTPDLSESEAQQILAAGLALMVVQHCPLKGWEPSGSLGKTYGENAASYAADAGLAENVNLWLDLEGIAENTDHQDIIDYCNAWFAAVATGGYEPGIYIGFDVWLSPDELFFNLKTQHYWRAAGNITEVSHRGYQLFQHIQNPGASEFDWDVAKNDSLGGTAIWLAPGQPLVA
jgi:Domain of unknown function (DUF1906)